jgi:hypothetical protein
MAYDRDGTVFVRTDTNRLNPSILSQAQAQAMNDDVQAFNTVNPGYATLIFPELRDVKGYLVNFGGQVGTNNLGIQTSVNTTNGVDGTWTGQGNWVNSSATVGQMRTDIQTVNFLGVKAISFGGFPSGGWWSHGAMHVYGTIAAGQTPDRLRFWHPTLDEALDDNTSADGAWLDFGDATRSTTADKTFRIKNNSSTLTANGINLTTAALTDASPTLPAQFTYSDGGAFSTSLSVGNLAPNTLSAVITIRRTTPSNAALSLWTARVTADPTSWS